MTVGHYTNAQESFGIISGQSTTSSNVLSIGGGAAGLNAATSINLYTAVNNTTTTGTPRVSIDSSGLVTVGSAVAATNVEFRLNGVASKAQRIKFAESGVDKWLLGQGAASETDAFEIYNTNGQMSLSIAKATSAATFSGSVTATGGVVFGDAGGSGTSSSNTLDSYEEGTFTPITLGSTTAGTGTYGFQHGSYTKVGNLVTVNIYVDTSSHTGAGSLRVGGLPFTVKAGSRQYAAVSFGELVNVTKTADTVISGYTLPTTTTIGINQIAIGTTEATTYGVPMDGLARLLLTVTYQT